MPYTFKDKDGNVYSRERVREADLDVIRASSQAFLTRVEAVYAAAKADRQTSLTDEERATIAAAEPLRAGSPLVGTRDLTFDELETIRRADGVLAESRPLTPEESASISLIERLRTTFGPFILDLDWEDLDMRAAHLFEAAFWDTINGVDSD